MFAGAFKTDPYSIGHAHPLRIMSPTFETTLRDQKNKKWSQFSYKSDRKLHFVLYISILLTLLPSFGFISFKTRLVRGLAMSISLNFLRSFTASAFVLRVLVPQVAHGNSYFTSAYADDFRFSPIHLPLVAHNINLQLFMDFIKTEKWPKKSVK